MLANLGTNLTKEPKSIRKKHLLILESNQFYIVLSV